MRRAAPPDRDRLAPHALGLLGMALVFLAGLALAWLAHDVPLAPRAAQDLLRADVLSALMLMVVAAHGLVDLVLNERRPWPTIGAVALLSLMCVAGHLGAVAGLLAATALIREATAPRAPPAPGRRLRGLIVAMLDRPALCAASVTALGLLGLGLSSGEWRYGAPAAGAGLNSASFALLLAGAFLSLDGLALARGRSPAIDPLVAVGGLYVLLRLFSLGPWNLGWLFAALLVGGVTALWSAWAGAAASPRAATSWLGLLLGALVIVGAGLGSGAGVTLAGYALLTWPVLRLGLGTVTGPAWARWAFSTAVPLVAPFVVAWMAVAAAIAGGLTLLAAALWVAALLAALPPARLATRKEAREEGAPEQPVAPANNRYPWALIAAGLSVGLGVGAPAIVSSLLAPLVAQLQGGLTPFGELALWPWAGLIALDAARQPVATLPSLALTGLMLILSALCWVVLRLVRLRG